MASHDSNPPSRYPPPLPARSTSQFPGHTANSQSNPSQGMRPYLSLGNFNDPRSSSTQSLVPDDAEQHDKRKLLIIYIHGFRGTDASFQSLPAHVHHLVSIALAESHAVHTKIYPRYQTRGDMRKLAEEFSIWLTPHLTPEADVILCGHSLGGQLATEIVLLPPRPLEGRGAPFRHRILGTIGFDAPYLGLHPHVVKYGIKSLFKTPERPGERESRDQASNPTSPVSNAIYAQYGQSSPSILADEASFMLSAAPDPNYNPSFINDIKLSEPRAFFKNALHFVGKHSDHLSREVQRVFKTHWEYTSGLSDYSDLKKRYERIRALEDEDEDIRTRATFGRKPVPRVRFANYYTASVSLRRKSRSRSRNRSRSRSSKRQASSDSQRTSSNYRGRLMNEPHVAGLYLGSQSTASLVSSRASFDTPRISIEEHRGNQIIPKVPDLHAEESSPKDTATLSSTLSKQSQPLSEGLNDPMTISNKPFSPSLPLAPLRSSITDPSSYPDTSTPEATRKEHAQAVKDHEQTAEASRQDIKLYNEQNEMAVEEQAEARQEILKEDAQSSDMSQPLPPQHSNQSDLHKAQKALAELLLSGNASTPETIAPPPLNTRNASQTTDLPSHPSPNESETALHVFPSASTTSISTHHSSLRSRTPSPPPDPSTLPTKKFCMLPPRSSITGQRDPAWVKVLMEGWEPVGAHSGIFDPHEFRNYEALVGDVAERIENWVREDMTRRVIEQLRREDEEVESGTTGQGIQGVKRRLERVFS
jgi:pimeloyl-ACP methyl ester carboxylesterase